MRRSPRWIRWVAVMVAGTALVLWALRSAPTMVDVGVVTRGPLIGTVDEEGVTRVRDRFVVAAPVSGRLRRITVQAGDSLAAGAAVASLEPSPLDPRTRSELAARLEAALDGERVARAASTQAREALDQAVREHARVEALFRQNVIAPELRERAALAETSRRRELEAADFRSQAAAHDTEQARAAATAIGGRVTVRSPVEGRVLRVVEPSERVVAAGTPLLEVGDPRHLEIVADVLSTDAVRIAPGDTMRVVGWGGPDSLVAILDRVEPSGFTKVSALGVEEQRVNVVGTLVAPPAALGDRYRADVQIALWRTAAAVRVPRSALFRAADTWRIFVVQAGRARERVVVIGRQASDLAEVVDGLAPGDQVILHPDERIVDGTRIVQRSTAQR